MTADSRLPGVIDLPPKAIDEFQDLVRANLDSYNVLIEAAERMNGAKLLSEISQHR